MVNSNPTDAQRVLRGAIQPETVQVRLLGGFSVSVGARVIQETEWRLQKAKSLIKLLALAPVHRLHREQLIDILWAELEPDSATSNLHYALHATRRVLEPVLAARPVLAGARRTSRPVLAGARRTSRPVPASSLRYIVLQAAQSRSPAAAAARPREGDRAVA